MNAVLLANFSVWQLLIVAILVVVLFGRGKISDVMSEFGKGIKGFKKGLNEGEESADVAARKLDSTDPAAPGANATIIEGDRSRDRA
ncbi:twin-arginine translocase TatA/TatE family subunit [Neomegalonema sp.]|uniref:twin-arginine translocase TatA/TatE family subunit n=1 Tax=Neomegalonema sp. TaxID=2039713 RepID=UPI002631C2C6|nr:twin-arginine translocase TatA/TatE family subunit [Neomegalonema sp.]MDD2869160.1 twin-arginine translocase TatA/TatE family subunit [Neomegalonema sp.]